MSTERAWNLAVRSTGSDELEIAVYDVIGSMFGDGLTAKNVFEKLRSAPKAKKISLRVNSVGGVVDDAKAMINLLADRAANGATVEATIDGLAASAASYLLTAASKVIMPANAFLMIHGVRGGARGTASDLEAAAALFRRTNDQLAEGYAAASARRGKGKTKQDFLASFAAGDRYLDADEAIAWGLADQKIGALKVAACLADIGELESAPTALRSAIYVTASGAPPAHARATQHVQPRTHRMQPHEILANYPETHAQIFAAGAESERRRVNAHLKLGARSGAAAYALECIKSGVSSTDEDVSAEYLSAGMSARDRSDRQADSDLAGAIIAGAKTGSGAAAGGEGSADDGEDPPLLAQAADIYCGPRRAKKGGA